MIFLTKFFQIKIVTLVTIISLIVFLQTNNARCFQCSVKKKVYYYSYFFVIYTFYNSSDSTWSILSYPCKSSVYCGVQHGKAFFHVWIFSKAFCVLFISIIYQNVFFSLILRGRTIIILVYSLRQTYTSFSRRKMFYTVKKIIIKNMFYEIYLALIVVGRIKRYKIIGVQHFNIT